MLLQLYNAFGPKIITPKLRHQRDICWLGKELPWQNGLAHIHFMNKTCLMSGSSHIQSVLIGVEYRNCC